MVSCVRGARAAIHPTRLLYVVSVVVDGGERSSRRLLQKQQPKCASPCIDWSEDVANAVGVSACARADDNCLKSAGGESGANKPTVLYDACFKATKEQCIKGGGAYTQASVACQGWSLLHAIHGNNGTWGIIERAHGRACMQQDFGEVYYSEGAREGKLDLLDKRLREICTCGHAGGTEPAAISSHTTAASCSQLPHVGPWSTTILDDLALAAVQWYCPLFFLPRHFSCSVSRCCCYWPLRLSDRFWEAAALLALILPDLPVFVRALPSCVSCVRGARAAIHPTRLLYVVSVVVDGGERCSRRLLQKQQSKCASPCIDWSEDVASAVGDSACVQAFDICRKPDSEKLGEPPTARYDACFTATKGQCIKGGRAYTQASVGACMVTSSTHFYHWVIGCYITASKKYRSTSADPLISPGCYMGRLYCIFLRNIYYGSVIKWHICVLRSVIDDGKGLSQNALYYCSFRTTGGGSCNADAFKSLVEKFLDKVCNNVTSGSRIQIP
ncbi:hypothetical protein VOLCADRAFT_87949 [Volvox carteri f. nagariensis]|uniref:Uncharacterized protein n=1 Tax=Volvox carteri f. nagariensis TaxID=3068 RepID=D8TMN7_VOLCA|nr:uncharacterized protein VOLCADRAFT_87949 [Volvox carteri f. nagariensis]EFJ51158.1 hypothetical protein VOLCADRAFT_87949 [Volvox carteri f. nagariensis]|eukprot:XP_002947625.1 hypothetical protein VOLCADRAFT_87949 [Volvox carteri f. nagariensis]